ncbi:MAG: hypothetical protein M3400_03795 [Actinomycetota bacterium]|nr:hypothetical protein [Actinomycetota bacterium]
MAEKSESAGKGEPGGRKQDPRVEQLRPDPSEPPPRGQCLSGLWGDSDRAGFRRLYFTSALDSYAEFRVEDVVATVDIPADQAPFLGEQSTRVELRHDAPVDFTVSRASTPASCTCTAIGCSAPSRRPSSASSGFSYARAKGWTGRPKPETPNS